MPPKRVTIADVARLADVSTATVSRVLGESRRVAPEIVERVHAAREELGYRYNQLARGLRTNESTVIGVVVPDVLNPYFTEIVRGMEDHCIDRGYLLVLCDTDESPERELRYLNLLADQRVAGVAIACARDVSTESLVASLGPTPLVLIDRVLDLEVDSVAIDNERAAFALTEFLLQYGRSPALITGPLSTSTARERVAGFRRALEMHGVDFDPKMHVESDHHEAGGFSAAAGLLARPERPSGILAGNNLMARGAGMAYLEAGVSVDELPLAACGPRLVEHFSDRHAGLIEPTYHMGQAAGRILLNRIDALADPIEQIRFEARVDRGRPPAH